MASGSLEMNATQWPVSAEDWEARARETLEQGPFDYVAGGAGSESTVRANREAFERRPHEYVTADGYLRRPLDEVRREAEVK